MWLHLTAWLALAASLTGTCMLGICLYEDARRTIGSLFMYAPRPRDVLTELFFFAGSIAAALTAARSIIEYWI